VSSGSDSSVNEESSTSSRRNTIATSNWKARDFNNKKERKRIRYDEAEDEEDPLDSIAAEIKLKPPRLSLPISVESIANRHDNKQPNNIIPVHAPTLEKKEQIKARFSIGSKASSTSTVDDDSSNSPSTPRLSTASSISATPIKRKRRLTGNLYKPPSTTYSTTADNISLDQLEIIPESNKKQTIVLTSIAKDVRKLCEEAIKKLGKFELESE
jgi:hypothetical protein